MAQTGVVNLVFDQTATGLQNDCRTITTNSMHCSAAAQLIYFQVFSFLNNIAVHIYLRANRHYAAKSSCDYTASERFVSSFCQKLTGAKRSFGQAMK